MSFGSNVAYRLLITDCAASGPTSIAEWKMFLSPLTQLPMDGTYVSASSVSSGANAASAAVDGDDTTYWESSGHPSESSPEWLSWAFVPASSYIPLITWFSITAGLNFAEAPTRFSLQIKTFNDPGKWKVVNGPISVAPWSYAGQTRNFCAFITPCTPMPLPTPPPPPPGSPATAATLTVRSSFLNTPGSTETPRIILFNLGGGGTNLITGSTPYGLRSDSIPVDSQFIPVINGSGDIVVGCYIDSGAHVTGSPLPTLLVYDCYLDVSYADGSSARLRPTSTDMDYSGGDSTIPGYGAVTDPLNAIDADADPPTTFATFTRTTDDFLDLFNVFELRFTFPI